MMHRVFRTFAAPILVFVGLLPATLHAQTAEQRGSILLGAEYSWLHSNIVPGCNCIALNGGGLQMEARFHAHLAALADVNITHAGGLTQDHYALTQTVYGFGFRYLPWSSHARYQPFGEVLLGGAYASGGLSPARTGYGSATALAVQAGGGLRFPLNIKGLGTGLLAEPVRVDYLYTTFANGAADQQNDLRLSAGILVRLGR